MKKIKLTDLWQYPIGIRLTIDWQEYWFIKKSEYGYYLFDGYKVTLEDDEDMEGIIHPISEDDIKKLQVGLAAHLMTLLDEPFIHKDAIELLLARLDVASKVVGTLTSSKRKAVEVTQAF